MATEPQGLMGGYRYALTEKKSEHAVYLADGKAQSYEDYKYRCGIVAGLRIAREEFDRCVKKYVEEE